jgi:DegV family protein with EDD domain
MAVTHVFYHIKKEEFRMFTLITDQTTDIPRKLIKEWKIDQVLPLSITFKTSGETYKIHDEISDISVGEFYKRIPNEPASTSQVTPMAFVEVFEPYVKAGQPILYTGLSSGLSKTYESSLIARNELIEKYPDCRIECIDSLSVAGGLGLLVMSLAALRNNGASIDDAIKWLVENRLKVIHLFTVDDLTYLHRGGRISTAKKILGTLAGVNPVLHVLDGGTLDNYGKERGINKALRNMANKLYERILDHDNPVIWIANGDCLEKAEKLRTMLAELIPNARFFIGDDIRVGSVVGTHVGPSVLAVFAYCSHR